MPVRKGSSQQRESPYLRLAGLILRRRSGREFHSYTPLTEYVSADYEVLLRTWPSEPFASYLGTFSGPVVAGSSPEETLLRESQAWTRKLGEKAGLTHGRGIQGRRAVFLSAHGGGSQADAVSGKKLESGVFVCYVVPLTHSESTIISKYPESPDYPKFYNLHSLLRGMVDGTMKVHPHSREMLSSLDHWLRERHAVPGAINALFATSLYKRLKVLVTNPLFEQATPPSSLAAAHLPETPPRRDKPLLSSTAFSHGDLEEDDDSTFDGATPLTVAQLNETFSSGDHNSVDVFVKNPLYRSEMALNKTNRYVANEHFGKGTPDYQLVGAKRGKWTLEVQEDGLPDWIDLFPLHKCVCEGDSEGVRRCIRLGIPADERDSDSWAPLHYACWYGELEVVKVLVEEGSAALGIQNSSGSTPLHMAAATGHKEVVSYLLGQRGIEQVKMALDEDGRSPLAVCLECKMNNWRETEQVLREAYKRSPPDGPALSSALLHFTPPREPVGGAMLPRDLELGYKGSLANLEHGEQGVLRKKQTLRRQRVNFMNGQHQVAHFFKGRETPASEVIQDIYRLLRLSREYHWLFSLWIASGSLELQLGDADKPLKLLASWNSLLTQHAPKGVTQEVPELFLRRNVFSPLTREKMVSDPTALEFLYADALRHVLTGYYPCTEEYAISLAGISMQVAHGDYNAAVHQAGFLKDRLDEVLPSHMATSRRKVEFERRILSKYSEISQMNVEDTQVLHKLYLKYCWRWPYYGAIFYDGMLVAKAAKLPPSAQGRLGRKSHLPVKVGVNTVGFHIVNKESNSVLLSVGFHEVEWDVSAEKNELVLYRRDKSLSLLIHTRKAGLIYRVVLRLNEQYLNTSQTSFTSSSSTHLPPPSISTPPSTAHSPAHPPTPPEINKQH